MDANQNNNQQNVPQEPMSRRDARQERRAARGGMGAWVGGLILIGLGIVFLLQNQGILVNFPFTNWWALFILLPAISALGDAWRAYQTDQTFSKKVLESGILGIVLVIVACVFLFELSWNLFGPVLLMIAGIGILLGGIFRH